MTFPFFSLRGTHPRTMLDDICGALDALRTAEEKLGAISPHARDYATASEFAAAVREHSARIDAVRGVIRELETLAEVWAAEGDKRSMKRGLTSQQEWNGRETHNGTTTQHSRDGCHDCSSDQLPGGESAPPEYGVEPLEERWRISGEGLIDYTLADQWGNELVSALYDPVEEEWDTDSDGCCVPDGADLHLPDDEMIRDAAEVRAYVLKLKEEDANEY